LELGAWQRGDDGREGNVLFTVTRSHRMTPKGATSALTEEFVKMLARFYEVHN